MAWTVTSVLTALAAVVVALYLYFQYRFTYWKKLGVPFPKPTPFVGNFGPIYTLRKNFMNCMNDLALPFREKGFCGVYQWAKPLLMVWDPELVKQILCKDFSSFHDRGQPADERDPLSMHLFNLSGTKWRNLRNRLSPAFTSGKLKMMLPLMLDVSTELSTVIAEDAKKDEHHEVEVDKLLNRFATDIIGNVAFGIQCNTLRDEKNEFLTMTKSIFRMTAGQLARFILLSIHPKLASLVPFKMLFSKVHNFFITLMKDTVEYREENKVNRNDFVQLMMALRDADLSQMDSENYIELTPGVMAAQGFIFFIAGLDNVSNTIAFALNKLALDTELQDKVAAEVRDVLQQHDGEMSYEALKKMELVNCTVLEALRLWSPIGVLVRKCNETTRVGDILVEKNIPVMILTDLIHTDEDIYPDPKRFDPYRHTAEARLQRHPYSFLPFGEGPRVCIAERLALLEMKLALAVLLKDYVFSAGPRFEAETVLDSRAFFPRPKNGFPMRVEARR